MFLFNSDNSKSRLSLALLAGLTLGAAGMAGTAIAQDQADLMTQEADAGNDAQILQEVQARIQAIPDVNAADIRVEASGGTVTLSGVVSTPEAQQQLLAAIHGVDGVERIDDSGLSIGE